METVNESIRARRIVGLTLGVGIALVAAVSALALTRSPPRVVRVGTSTRFIFAYTIHELEICQSNELLPAGVTAIRLSVGAFYGSKVRVRAYSGSRVLTEGSRGPDWTSNSVTVPVTPLPHTTSHMKLCIEVGPNREPIRFAGVLTPARESAISRTGQSLGDRVGVEYLASGKGSWWSRILSVARHMGIGHALDGTWVVLLIAALMAAVGLLATRVALRELPSTGAPARRIWLGWAAIGSFTRPVSQRARAARRRIAGAWVRWAPSGRFARVGAAFRHVPTLAWMCALIAFLNAFAWSLIVPPFQGKDEADHFAYIEQLAESGTLPENGQEVATYSPEESLVLRGLHYNKVAFTPQTHAISSVAEQAILTEDVNAGASPHGPGEAGIATSEPPLYYALQAIPYDVARGNILTQLQLMRLFGALFGAVTALLAFLFLREALPGVPWAATVGGLCVALQPLFAFMSGSVNPDTMLFAVSAALFLCLARAFARGFTRGLAIVLGVLVAVGFMTKLNFVGIALGVFVGLVVLAVRGVRSGGRGALLAPAIAAGIGLSPAVLYALRNILSSHPTFGILSGIARAITASSLVHELSYIWQVFLPRLPGMTHYFAGIHTYKDIWFDRSVGLYGWMDTMFATWVNNVALIPVAAIVLLCARELFVRGDALRARLPELGVYAAIAAGILVMIGASSYLSDAINHRAAFGEPRYLLPLLPLLGAVIALAVRGAGRRWAPLVGAAIVVLFLGHDVFSQLQVIARYYG